uniref:Rho guanine nucleotide exchange factor 39 n=1 Tax=Sphenodon punctatus TaxID=8508 RepID=A0A8D0G5Y8_SPHPU
LLSGSSLATCNPVEEQRARWERKRGRTAKELVETEQKYLEQLELVATVSLVRKAPRTLRCMERRPDMSETGGWTDRLIPVQGHLGPGLEGFCQQLALYGHYAENVEQARRTLQDLVRKNKSFCRFKKLQESRHEFQGLRLEDLLPLPLQRLHQLRMPMLISGAVESISEVSQWVQNTTRHHENSLQMVRVQKLLKGQKTKVLTPGRWYIREGWIMVVPPKGEEVKRKMFFLFSDILVVTKPCHPLHPLNSHKFACQAVYPLDQCVVGKVFGHTESQGGLLSLSFPHKTLLLMSSHLEDLNNWHQSLTAAIR